VRVNVSDDPDAKVVVALFVHISVARVQVHPAGPVSPVAVVPAGAVSVTVIEAAVFDPAVAGPRFFTVCVYVMLLPAVTGFGLAAFAMLRSASVALATAMFTVTELSAGLLSFVADAAVAVSVIIVPAAKPVATVYTAVIVTVDPGGTLGFVQATGPVLGQVHVPLPVVTAPTEEKVVLAGVASLNVAVEQLLGPWLVTVCV